MKLSELAIKPSYTKTDDDIAEEFYLPCMRNSNAYDRISGYFGSTIYIIAWDQEPNIKSADGSVSSDALPDFIVCINSVKDENKEYCKSLETFNK